MAVIHLCEEGVHQGGICDLHGKIHQVQLYYSNLVQLGSCWKGSLNQITIRNRVTGIFCWWSWLVVLHCYLELILQLSTCGWDQKCSCFTVAGGNYGNYPCVIVIFPVDWDNLPIWLGTSKIHGWICGSDQIKQGSQYFRYFGLTNVQYWGYPESRVQNAFQKYAQPANSIFNWMCPWSMTELCWL